MLHQEKNGVRATLGRADLLLLGMALLLCLYSFMANHSLVYEGGVPESFPWLPFGAGMLLGLFVLVKAARFRPASGVASPD
jgi:hypothetical protein